MFESKKSQILVAHQKEDMDGAKKVWLPAKKSSARVQRISHLFWGSWTPPMESLKAKNLKFLLLIKRKILMAQKKYGYPPKKVRLGFRGFRTYIWEVEHPLWDVWKQKISNSRCLSKGRYGWQKRYSYPPKKVRLGSKGFRTYFWEVEHPLWDVWNNLIGAHVFGKAKNYKPTWTQNHPWAEGLRWKNSNS